jgi:hypothetical protein
MPGVELDRVLADVIEIEGVGERRVSSDQAVATEDRGRSAAPVQMPDPASANRLANEGDLLGQALSIGFDRCPA